MSDSEPVSVLLISHSYPPVLGGSEIEAQRICAGLMKRGHRVQVLCAGGPPMPPVTDWVDPAGVPVRIIGANQSGLWRDRFFALGVARELIARRADYQIVYFLMQGLHLATGLPVARLLRKPVVMKFSGSSLITQMKSSAVGRLELGMLRRWAKRIMILNSGMVEEAVSAGFDRAQLLWMPNPVDTAEFSPCDGTERNRLRRKHSVPENSPVVVFVGRLAPEKELLSLVRAFARVIRHNPAAELILIGDGPSGSELKTCVNELQIGVNVRFTGRVEMNIVREWLRLGDAFALVSSNEGFPCSLLEAMSSGLPSVVSDIPANTQLVEDRVQGLVAGLRDKEALASALIRLLDDPALRMDMGRNARQVVVENYSTDKVIDRYESLFATALSDR